MYRIFHYDTPEEVSRELARFMAEFLTTVITEKGVAKLGLAGGNSPRETYALMRDSFHLWERVLIFPTDERFVPSEDPESNYRMLREYLGDRAKVYRVKTELPLREACEDFDRALSKAGGLDLVLLGIGRDGHTASIFPGVPCKSCGENACTSKSPDGLDRISMSLSYINHSYQVAFLVLGEEKRDALERLLEGDDIPASRVSNGKEIYLFTDLLPASRSQLQSKRSKR